jgi:hypothetical protein
MTISPVLRAFLRLQAGITKVSQLRDMTLHQLHSLAGDVGAFLFGLINGKDSEPIIPSGPPKTMSEEDTLYSCPLPAQVRAKLQDLVASLERRIREDEAALLRRPQTLRITARPAENPYGQAARSRQAPIPQGFAARAPVERVDMLMGVALELMHGFEFQIGVVNVGVTNFSSSSTGQQRLDGWRRGTDEDACEWNDVDAEQYAEENSTERCEHCMTAIPAWAMEAHAMYHNTDD